IAIPFKTIRYNPEITKWGLNFSRTNLKINEISAWSPVPRNFNVSSLVFAGGLIWDANPPAAGVNLAVIPYIRANYGRDFVANEQAKTNFTAGADFKIGITSSLNLD